MTTIGKNYKSGRTFDEVLALVKRDLRDALPKGVKISVRKEGCTYTNKIDVRVMSAPEEVLDWQKCTQYEREERYAHFIWPRNLTAFGEKVFGVIQRVILSYRYDDSDIMTDYFDTNFYYEMGAGRFQKPFKVVSK
jgi:hypothetical protein